MKCFLYSSPNNDGVAFTELALEVLWRAKATELAVDHDGQAGAQRLALLHTDGKVTTGEGTVLS